MKNITQILSDEHQTILKAISVILRECEEIENGEEINIDFFQRVLIL